ncbi:hypothetical protein BC835DRAFT_1081715 [Cytidiella melzeri]|nr:hypothetical protein BC835DRAFT_1081715 [Cytidiella melzeri]
MSARQPFVPQGMAAPLSSDISSNSLNTSMSSDGDGSNRSSATSLSLHSNSSEDISLAIGNNKPLNIASLMKKKKSVVADGQPFQPKPRKAFEDEVNRPFSPSAKPFNQRSAKTSPFFPSSATFQSMAAFRAPRVPSPTKRHSAASIEDLNTNSPHTVTSGTILGPDCNDQHLESSSHVGLSRRSQSSRGVGDKPKQAQDTDEDRSRSARNAGLDAFDREEPNSSLAHHYDVTYNAEAIPNDDRYTTMPLRRVQKRIERTEEISDDLDYSASKRYKLDNDDDLQSNFGARHGARTPFQTSPRRTPSPATSHAGQAYIPSVPPSGAHNDHALSRLLGEDFDAHADAHITAYEEAKKKWASCTIEEWTAGADELTAKFGRLLDIVKEHMNTKLSLYATLTASLTSHREVLKTRENTLDEVRDTLIQNGGNVCGIGKGKGGAVAFVKAIDLNNQHSDD